MVTYTFVDGTPAEAAEVNQNFTDVERLGINIAESNVRTLQSNNIFTNGPNNITDEFVSISGTNNTLYYLISTTDNLSDSDTQSTTGFIDFANVYDNDNASYALANNTIDSGAPGYLGNTFSASTIKYIEYNAIFYITSSTGTIKLQSYNGSIWSDVQTLGTGSGTFIVSGTYYLNSSVQGLRLSFTKGDSSNDSARVYTWKYTTSTTNIPVSYSSSLDKFECIGGSGSYQTNSKLYINTSITLDSNEEGFAISIPDSDIPTGTSITVTIGDGTSTLTPVAIDSVSKGCIVPNDGTLIAGNLEVTFTLATTDTSLTPTLSSYGVNILR